MQKIIRNLWVILLLIPILVKAADNEPFKEGKDYRRLKDPVQTSVKPDSIEVSEVFWYGCPHCYDLESIVDRWKPSLSKEVEFLRVPGFFGSNIWQTHAQLYYTLKSMFEDEKALHQVHDVVFNEIQEKNNRLANEKEMAEFLKKRFQVDEKKFLSYYNSFGVQNLLNQASSKVQGYRLTGVPVLVVDGRYVIEPKVGLQKMPEVADYLIKKVSEKRAKTKKQP